MMFLLVSIYFAIFLLLDIQMFVCMDNTLLLTIYTLLF